MILLINWICNSKRFIATVIVVEILGVSCNSNLRVKTIPGQSQTGDKSIQADKESSDGGPGQGTATGTIEVDGVSSLTAKSGDEVTITGKNFQAGMTVDVNGETVLLRIKSPELASFTMPDGVGSKLIKLTVAKDGTAVGAAKLITLNGLDNIPVLIIDPSLVCSDVQFYNGSGVLVQGTRGCPAAPTNCSTSGQSDCYASGSFKAINMTGIVASDIRSGVTIGNLSGTAVIESHADCTGNGQTGCVSTTMYKSADLSNLSAGNIKAGVSLAGITGDYPSATNPLSGSTVTADLDLATFNAKLKSATNFEWWDSAGTRYVNSGDTNIIASNILNTATILGTTGSVTVTTPTATDLRYGVTVNGVTGSLKTNCRNLVATGTFDNTTAPASTTAGTVDPFDTLDWYYGPSQNPWVSSEYVCGSSDWAPGGTDAGGTAGYCNELADECFMTDSITKLSWSESPAGTFTWQQALDGCDVLTFGGYSDWRVPTQFEMMEGYIHNINSRVNANWVTGFGTGQFWSSTTSSLNTANAWAVRMDYGFATNAIAKTTAGSLKYLCVRP